MKIAYVLHQFLPRFNSGTEQYVYHLAKRLIGRGEEVKVFTFEPRYDTHPPFTGVTKDEYDGIPVTRVSGWMGHFPNIVLADYYNPFFGKLFGEFLEDEGIEAVHSFQNQYMGVSVLEEAYLRGLPVVANLMDFWYLCPHVQLLKHRGTLCRGPSDYTECINCRAADDATYRSLYPFIEGDETVLLEEEALEGACVDFLAGTDVFQRAAAMAIRPRLIRRALQLVDVLVSPSLFLKSMFVENGHEPERFTHVRYGIELEALKGIEKTRTETLRLGFIGTITAHKGLDTLVESVRAIEGDRLSLDVYGDMNAFPEFSGRVRELADNDPRIRFKGRFEAPELRDVLGGIDVLVVPSVWYENTPFVILEALASGTPVIASDLGGLSELINVGMNGLLFEPGNARDLTEKITALLNDRGLVESYHPGRSDVRSLDDNAEEFLDLYRRLKETDMNADRTAKNNEILKRHNRQLMGQLFHLITMNSGQMGRIAELEQVLGDKAYLAEQLPPDEAMEIPGDLSPSLRRRLREGEEMRLVLRQRSAMISELNRQIEQLNSHARNLDKVVKDREEAAGALRKALADREGELERMRQNPVFKSLGLAKRILKGGK